MEVFSKVLVARYNPKNKCNVENGVTLIVKPLVSVPMRDHVPHYFVSAQDGKTRSKYGWVEETEPFSLDDFIHRYWRSNEPADNDRMHLETMLRSIAKLAPDTPCAATYSRRGIETKRMAFTVHRVFFYDA